MAAGKKFEAAKQQVENRPYTVPDAMDLLVNRLQKTKTNAEFLMSMKS